jgi:hypothetical protein
LAKSAKLLISLLVGEMSGRTEGGAKGCTVGRFALNYFATP